MSTDEINKIKDQVDQNKVFALIGMIAGCIAAVTSILTLLL